MERKLRTTRPVLTVRSIEDIRAIEARPYDELVTARNLHDLLLATATHVGAQQALTVLRSEDSDDIGITLTHAELLQEVRRAANMFRALGLAPGSGVAAFLAPTLPELPVLLLGAQIAGVASTLNYLLGREAIVDLLNAQRATILVIPARRLDETCWSRAQGIADSVPTLRHVLVIGEEAEAAPGHVPLGELLRAARGDALDFTPEADRDTVCALFHTGGTTGRPKLVRLTHGNQIHAAFGFGQVFGYDETDTVINGFPFFHVGGTMTVGLAVIAAGGHVVVPGPYALRPRPVIERYWEIVERFRATVIGGVPTSIAALTETWQPGRDVSTVRMAGTGGAVLPRAVGARFEAATGIRLFETYGMTETAAAIAFNPGRGTPVPGSVGFRAPYSEIRIQRLDAGASEPCPPGERGLVQLRGPQVFPGYLDPAHDAGTLLADGWLNTGDIGYLTEDERLVLTGRAKDLIVRSGHNIDPAAIEDVANRFAGVQISAAVGMPDQYAGEVPALFVVPAAGAPLDIEALRRHLDAHVPEPPARPRSIITIDALPVTAVGKIFKPALRDLAIREKVRQETGRICGPGASASVDVRSDAQGRTIVDVAVSGANAEGIAALAEALKPLAQEYRVHPAEAVELAIADGIAVLTLNRPQALNAISHELASCFARQLDVLERRADLRAVVITGRGRAFCAGGDLIEFEEALRSDPRRLLDLLAYNQDLLQRVEDLPVPVIAAVNGVAVAGGLELILCCDLVIAAEGARIGDGHVRHGIVPAGGATVRLMEKLPPVRAAQLLHTGALIDAAVLAQWGLVNEVVPADRLMDHAMSLAREIAGRSPEAIRHIKALTGRLARGPERQVRLRAELQRFAQHLEGKDLARGLAAFRNRQEVRF